MEIVSNKNETIFRKDYEGRTLYSIGLSKKDKDGNYVYGYMPCSFRKGVELQDKTKIRINSGWIDFYKNKEDKTVPGIFINEFDIAEENMQKNA